LSTALVDAGGGTRRKAGPQPVQEPKPLPKPKANAKAAAQPGRAGTRPITVHYPKQVRDQLKILAVEQETTLQGLVGEAFNMLFAKYGKPEIAPTEQRD
jgi:hypothetical protein